MSEMISITRALTEIKHLGDRITRASSQPMIGISRGRGERMVCLNSPNKTVDDVKTTVSGNYQSAVDLINRREKLKRLVIKSNASTMVKINGVDMTVAEAIELKASIGLKTQLLQNLRHQYTVSKTKVDAENQKLKQEIETAVTAAYGNEKGKVEESQYFNVADPRLKVGELNLIDPIDIEAKISALEHEIDGFTAEVDFVLSESNARTSIEV